MDLNYNVVYSSRRKTLSITVERDRSVVVTAPTGTPIEKIKQVVESRKLWLYEKIHHAQKYKPLLHPPGKELVDGESLLYLGQSYQLELTDTAEAITLENNRFLVPSAQAKQQATVFRDWYVQQAKTTILPRVQQYADRLGVAFNQAKITDSRYRWGSCTPKNNVTLNWRLIKAPMFVIDYVIVHELTHLLEPNHTSRFWGIIHSQIAQMDKAKQWLKVHGSLLDDPI